MIRTFSSGASERKLPTEPLARPASDFDEAEATRRGRSEEEGGSLPLAERGWFWGLLGVLRKAGLGRGGMSFGMLVLVLLVVGSARDDDEDEEERVVVMVVVGVAVAGPGSDIFATAGVCVAPLLPPPVLFAAGLEEVGGISGENNGVMGHKFAAAACSVVVGLGYGEAFSGSAWNTLATPSTKRHVYLEAHEGGNVAEGSYTGGTYVGLGGMEHVEGSKALARGRNGTVPAAADDDEDADDDAEAGVAVSWVATAGDL